MSQEQAKTTVDGPTDGAIDALQDGYGLEYRSDAIRVALRRGLSNLGYLGGGAAITPGRKLVREIAKLLLYVAATLAVLSVGTGLAMLSAALGVWAGSMALFATDRWVLPRVEPALTKRLPRVDIRNRKDAW